MGLWEDIRLCGPKGTSLENIPYESVPYEFMRRDRFISKYAWAVPSREAVKRLKEFVGRGLVLEVGSGKGLWAKLLQEEGVSVTATDDMSWTKSERFDPSSGQFLEVLNMDAEVAVRSFPGHEALLMVWPPYDDPMAEKALNGFSGNKLILVGEDKSGCTANKMFFNDLGDQWDDVGRVSLPQWPGIHDMMTFWSRKPLRNVECTVSTP